MNSKDREITNIKEYFEVIYGDYVVKDCFLEEIDRELTIDEPKVNLLKKKDGVYYTLIMMDPDAPFGYLNSDVFFSNTPNTSYGCTIDETNKSYGCVANANLSQYGSTIDNNELTFKYPYENDPRNKTFLHWWVSNIVYENGKLKNAEEWISYYPPTPPYGKHRYYFYLLEQQGYIKKNINGISETNRQPFYYELWKNRLSWKLLQFKGFIIDSFNENEDE